MLAECDYAIVDASDNSTTVHTGRCRLYGVQVTTALSAHACPIQDGSNVIGSLAASSAIGTLHEYPGVVCNTSLVVNPDDSATGILVVYYKVF